MQILRQHCFLLTTESFDRSHFRPNSSEINREHSTNTMELVNISQTGGPVNNYVQLGITLKEMGLKVVKCLTTSEVTNPTALEPDEFHSFAVENNMPVYWLMLTVEEFNSLIPLTNTGENKLLPTISGATRMPAFDKMIFNMSPQLAATTLVYHQTEGHCSTAETTQWILLSFQQDHQQNQLRLANGAITVFNRGYVAPQMQLPWNRTLRFNNYELSTQQSWVITTTSETTSLLWTVHDRLSWKHNILWTFNVPVDASKVINTDANEWPQVVQALAYTGLQALDHFDDDINKRIKGLLTQSHPLIQQRSMLNTIHPLAWSLNSGAPERQPCFDVVRQQVRLRRVCPTGQRLENQMQCWRQHGYRRRGHCSQRGWQRSVWMIQLDRDHS